MVIGILLDLAYAARLAAGGMTPEQVDAALKSIPPESTVAVLGMLLGSLCSVAGGYACARIVRRDEYRVAAMMAALSLFISLLLGAGDQPPDMLFLLSACEVACVLLGAKYGRAHNRRETVPARGGA